MDVQMQGAAELVNRLARFDKDVYKVLQREIRSSMAVAAKDIKSGVPQDRALRKWGVWNLTTGRNSTRGAVRTQAGSRDLGYRGRDVSGSVKYGAKQARLRRVGTVGIRGWAGISNAGGAIFTTAGKRTDSDFTRHLKRKHGDKYPRVLAQVWVNRAEEIGKQIDAALDRARRSIGI